MGVSTSIRSWRRWALVSCWLACAATTGSGAATRIGSEFQVNGFTVANQNEARIAMSSGGAFVVAWTSDGQDNLPNYSYSGVFARRYDGAGQPIASEFQVNSFTADDQDQPSVAINTAGAFVVVWRSEAQDGALAGIFGQRFDSAGARLGSEFQVNSYTTYRQSNPDVALGANGAFVVVWQGDAEDGDDYGVFGRRFSSSGAALGGEFQINTRTTGSQVFPRMALGSNGELLVVWMSPQDGSANGIFARRFSPSGLLGVEFQVNGYTTSEQSLPAVAAGADGSFAVVWQSGHDGAPAGIFGRRFDSTGAALTTEFEVNTYTVGTQVEAEVASDGTDFIVAWQSAAQDGDNDGVFARKVSGTGTVEGAEFQVNAHTTAGQRGPTVGMAADGELVVAWRSFQQDGSSDGTFAQRFSIPDSVVLDVDGDGATAALTDGLLVLRHRFGFTGTTLTSGAVNTGSCTRCDAAAIGAYLDGLGLVLDIDDDGAVGALTDGLLVLRYLFDFTGTTLTNGIVNTGSCGRCDAAAIEPYLATLV